MPPFPGPPVPQADASGAIPVFIAPGGDATPVYIAPPPGLATENITTEAGTLVNTGPGQFLGLNVNKVGVTSTAEIIDGVDGTGTVLGTIDTTSTGPVFPGPGWSFSTGLFIITQGSTAADLTVSYVPTA